MPKPQPKPLVSASPEPRDMQFKHFGVMDSGAQDKASLFTSITVNVLLAIIIVIVGAAARKVVNDNRVKEAIYPVAIKEKPPEPPKPKPIPKIIPPTPIPPPVTPPKIKLPDVKIPDPPKPVIVPVAPAKPVPVVVPAQPKLVVAAAAPKVVSVKMPAQSASVVNHDAHPSAVALGSANNPIAPSNRPAVATAIDLGNRGLPGMKASNTGGGPASTRVSLGNGSSGGSVGGTGRVAVQGVALGVPGGTGTKPGGNGVGSQAQVVALGRTPPPPTPTATSITKAAGHPPQVTYKPRPTYTADATQNHIEGQIQVRIRVSASGAVTVIGIVGSGLGHGLDQSAMTAAQGIRFRPATDAAGNPTDWEGPVTITFQMA